jgi:glutaconate CoA-transferase subunit A
VAIEGFTHLISFAAGHEIIRQGRRDLTLARLTPDLVYDQLVAAGCARKLVFSWLGNPGVGSLHAIRRAIEGGSLEVEEYSHFGMVGRYVAGAAHLPFYPLRSYAGSDLPAANPLIRSVASPYDPDDEVAVVPPLNPDVTIIHAQRADAEGNVQVWGLVGVQREAALAAERAVIVVVEELVDGDVIRSDPDRTLLPGVAVTAVCVEPYGAHPSFAQGYYDRDNAFYRDWDPISRDAARLDAWLGEWVRSVPDRRSYVEKLGAEALDALKPGPRPSGTVDYGEYR